ncbi:MAG: class I SAM-dependent methyltransferase [Elusimicrobia bacterium]|nr:class I SAM-dependent methyltransferase [Elusimicrobiota bacterium]
MLYVPKVSEKEKEENHKQFSERRALYRTKSFDFAESRKFILQKAGILSDSILEIGTGYGDTAIALTKTGYKITAIDRDIESLKIAAANLAYENLLPNVKFYVMNAEAMDFKKESFKSAICVNLFHHIKKVDKVLSEADRVLSKKGRFILADFNKKGIEIVNKIHKDEGRIHENLGIKEDYSYSYLNKLGYRTKRYKEKYHWVLVSEK